MKLELIVLKGRAVRLEPLEARYGADPASAVTRKLFVPTSHQRDSLKQGGVRKSQDSQRCRVGARSPSSSSRNARC